MFSNPYIKKNIAMAWPLALNALLMQSMLMIDTWLVSPLGEVSLAALGIATAVLAFFLGIQMALANGTQLVLSRAVGSGKASPLAKAFWGGMIINMMAAFLFYLILAIFDQQIIELLTDDIALHQETLSYLAISKHLLIFTAFTQVMIALFNGLGKTRIPFKGYLIEMPINAILSYLLIHGIGELSGLGVRGAAIGSLIAITLRLIYLVLVLHLEKQIKLKLENSLSDLLPHIKQHFLEIFPVAANITILAIGMTIYQLLFSQLTIHAYVAITLVMPWIRAGTQFITAWAHSSAIAVSQAIGARDLDNLAKNVDTSIHVAVGMSFISALMFALLSVTIDRIYPNLDAETYTALAIIAPLYILLPIVRGYNTVHGHVLRALGKTTAVFKINFTGQLLISIPLCALIILYFDGSVFWAFAVLPFEEVIKAIPFRQLARKSLAEFDEAKAHQLAY